MKFRGRPIDPVALWENYVEFPANMKVDKNTVFLPLVVCPNPEHGTNKKHFQINVTQDTVHCFAHCGISGRYEDAIALIEGVTHREARRIIFRKAGRSTETSVGRVRSRKPQPVRSISSDQLQYERYIPQAGLDYLAGRGISAPSIARWELGWDAEEKRIVIPAKDRRNKLKFLIRRGVFPKQFPKYLYPELSERNRLLFGACQIDLGMVRSEGVVLVEGSLDCIRLHQNGFRNAVAILGSKLSEFQAREIANMRPRRVYTMFDADSAGVQATISAQYALHRSIPIRVCRYPKGKSDPAELTEKEARRSIERAISLSQFLTVVGYTRSKPRERISVG